MVSVIIPSYNREDTIERSVRSVLAQTYRNLEVIVVDDHSSDNTRQVVEAIDDDRVRYHCLENNSGACAARNKGLQLAKGDIIAFQDSDDAWRHNKLEKQIAVLEETHADVCFCQTRDHGYPDDHPILVPQHIGPTGIVSYKILYDKVPVGTQTIVAKKYVFDNVAFDIHMKKAQDVEWTFRAGRLYKFAYVDEPLVDRYLQDNSITMGGYKKSLEAHSYILKKYASDKKDHPDFYLSRLRMVSRLKVLCGESATDELREIYQMTHQRNDLMKYMFARLHVYGLLYDIKEKRKSKRVREANRRLLEEEKNEASS